MYKPLCIRLCCLTLLSLALLNTPVFASSYDLSVDDFHAPPDMLTAKLSPNGKYVASVWNYDKQRAVVIFDIQKSKVIHRFGDDIIRPYSVSWANDNRLLVKLLVPYKTAQVRRDAKRKDDFDIDDYFMFGRIVATDIDGEGLVSLMNDDRNVKGNVNLANITHILPDDPEHILMSAWRRDRMTLYKVNINSGESDRVVTGGRFTVAFTNDIKRQLLYRYDYRRISKTLEILKYTKESDEWVSVDTLYFDDDDRSKNKIELEDLAGLKDGYLVYRKLNEDTGFHELIQVKDGEKSVLVSLENTDIVGVITSGMDNEVIGYTTLTDVYRSVYFNQESQNIYAKAAKYFQDENFRFSNIAKNQSYAVIKSWGASNPVTYFTYDIKEDAITRFNYPYSSLPRDQLADAYKIQYLTRDKASITAYLYAPSGFDFSAPLPLIIMPHGGPQARDSLNYDDLTQFLSTRGYIVIKPNFRGSTGYGKAFEKAGHKQWGLRMQEDLEDAVAFLEKERLINPNKVCIVGASYGGYAALMGTIKTPSLYACAASINGVTHLPEQIEFDLDKFEGNAILTSYVKDTIGDPQTDAVMLQASSPALNAQRINTPILLVHGEEDSVVPYEQAELMQDALEAHNKNFKFVGIEDAGHNIFYYSDHSRPVYEALETFLSEHLGEAK
ncbi:alpha/beta fold hydrolase [Glaciecola siphonariae]|uniref:Alpha/beta fold hydrolase n=1 Tax=Glaciecola siphonariae TaxID=521012 RepID=A0ABV9LVY4_9ALTE